MSYNNRGNALAQAQIEASFRRRDALASQLNALQGQLANLQANDPGYNGGKYVSPLNVGCRAGLILDSPRERQQRMDNVMMLRQNIAGTQSQLAQLNAQIDNLRQMGF
ncbi:hypothetical protein PRZ48_013615 [Zasmidium cellare]|uniref:Uncharacterized protein n=1 Tax=Zasmidium cellare TaxID=395010 RepID=A0ABR0E1K8_ZASCE|nr:hypothetical protein PRZ48_013615 [Zasmidium cellare]